MSDWATLFVIKTVVAAGAGGVAALFTERFPHLLRPAISRGVRATLGGDGKGVRLEAERLAVICSDFAAGMCAALVLYISIMAEIWKLVHYYGLVAAFFLLVAGVAATIGAFYSVGRAWINHSEEQYANGPGRVLKWSVRGLFILLILVSMGSAWSELHEVAEESRSADVHPSPPPAAVSPPAAVPTKAASSATPSRPGGKTTSDRTP